jgi:hypothetical protein
MIKVSRSSGTRALGFAALVCSAVCLSACANIPYVAGEERSERAAAELVTGSNLARRNSPGTGAREIDKDALESSLRGSGAKRDTGN